MGEISLSEYTFVLFHEKPITFSLTTPILMAEDLKYQLRSCQELSDFFAARSCKNHPLEVKNSRNIKEWILETAQFEHLLFHSPKTLL